MTTQNTALVRDNSTLANFKSWGSTISAFFTTAGWTQSADTGQVNWSTIASVPTVGTFVYEIWEPNDGGTNFFFKVEYGTNSASTNTGPSMRFSIGTGSNGSGTLTGFVTTAQAQPNTVVTVSSTVTTFQCYFSGAAGRISVLMWRDDSANAGPLFFAVERSINSSGSYTNTYVTLITCGNNANNINAFQQSIVFGVGVGNSVVPASGNGGLLAIKNFIATSDLFNGNFPLSPVFPSVGYFDNPMTAAAVACGSDVTEGSTYTILAANMPYGVSHTYIAGKNAPLNRVSTGGTNTSCALLSRYD